MKLSMNIGYLVKLFPLEEVCRMVASAGFDAVDYSLEFMKERGHCFSGDNYLRLAEEIRKTLIREGVPATQTHAPFSFANYADKAEFDDFIFSNVAISCPFISFCGSSHRPPG